MRRHAPPTRWRVVAAIEEKSRAWRCVTHWLSPGLLVACRSGDHEASGGVAVWNGEVVGKVHWRVFRHCRGLTAAEDSRSSWDNGCDGWNKTQPLSGLSELRTQRSHNPNLP